MQSPSLTSKFERLSCEGGAEQQRGGGAVCDPAAVTQSGTMAGGQHQSEDLIQQLESLAMKRATAGGAGEVRQGGVGLPNPLPDNRLN